jgi:hypothetical protein
MDLRNIQIDSEIINKMRIPELFILIFEMIPPNEIYNGLKINKHELDIFLGKWY